jgi:hypothetical protein
MIGFVRKNVRLVWAVVARHFVPSRGRDQETLYVLQNPHLMKQIAESIRTHEKRAGHLPKDRAVNEILGS